MTDNEKRMTEYLDSVVRAVQTGGTSLDDTDFAEGDCAVLKFRLGHGPTRQLVVTYANIPGVIATLRESARLLNVISFEPAWLGDASVVSQLIDVA